MTTETPTALAETAPADSAIDLLTRNISAADLHRRRWAASKNPEMPPEFWRACDEIVLAGVAILADGVPSPEAKPLVRAVARFADALVDTRERRTSADQPRIEVEAPGDTFIATFERMADIAAKGEPDRGSPPMVESIEKLDEQGVTAHQIAKIWGIDFIRVQRIVLGEEKLPAGYKPPAIREWQAAGRDAGELDADTLLIEGIRIRRRRRAG